MSSLSSPPFIVDSHVHLWEDEHRTQMNWPDFLKPGHRLDRACTPGDYAQAILTPAGGVNSSPPPTVGYVYIETDRKNDHGNDWTLPLAEVAYARTLVEAEFREENKGGAARCLAIVPWAPVHSGPAVLERYLDAVREAAGPVAWPRVRGFRYLVQDKPRGTMLQDAFVDAVRLLGRRGFSFDLGIDARGRGRTQMAEAVSFVERVHTVPGSLGATRDDSKGDGGDGPPKLSLSSAPSVDGTPLPDSEKTVIIVNHMAKPDLTVLNPQADRGFAAWRDALFALARASPDHVFVKVSGLFSGMPPALRDQSPQAFFGSVYAWLAVVLAAFGPSRLMFGSDWPVCTVDFAEAEPAKETEDDNEKPSADADAEASPFNEAEASAWDKWRQIVAYLCYMASLDEDAKAMIWGGTAVKAYKLETKEE